MCESLSVWQLHDVYSLDEAAWLIVGESPSEDHQYSSMYDVYSGVRGALEKAIHDFGGNELEALVYSIPIGQHFSTHNPSIDKETLQADLVLFRPTLDYKELNNVTIPKPALIQWLNSKKHYPPFFFPEKSGEPTPTEKENIHVSIDPVTTLASDDLPAYLSERLVSFSSLVHDAYKLRSANPKANKATLIDLMCEELGVKDLEARQIDVMIRPPKGK